MGGPRVFAVRGADCQGDDAMAASDAIGISARNESRLVIVYFPILYS